MVGKIQESKGTSKEFLGRKRRLKNLWHVGDDDNDDGFCDVDNIPNIDGRGRKVPLLLHWFVDEDKNSKKKSSSKRYLTKTTLAAQSDSNVQHIDNIQNEVRMLQDKVQTMEQGFSDKLNSTELIEENDNGGQMDTIHNEVKMSRDKI